MDQLLNQPNVLQYRDLGRDTMAIFRYAVEAESFKLTAQSMGAWPRNTALTMPGINTTLYGVIFRSVK